MSENKAPPPSFEEQLRDAANKLQKPHDDLPTPPAAEASQGSLADLFGQAAAALAPNPPREEPPQGEPPAGEALPEDLEKRLRRAAQFQTAQRPDGDLREAVLLARPEEPVAEPPEDDQRPSRPDALPHTD